MKNTRLYHLEYDSIPISLMGSYKNEIHHSSNGIAVSEKLAAHFSEWKESYFDINNYLSSFDLSRSKKLRIKKELHKEKVLSNAWETAFLGDYFCSFTDYEKAKKICDLIINEPAYISKKAASKNFDVSKSRLNSSLIAEKLLIKNDKVVVSVVKEVSKEEEAIRPLNEYVNEFALKNDVTVTKHVYELYKKELIESNNNGDGYKSGEYLLKKGAVKNEIYVSHFSEDSFKKFLLKNAFFLNPVSTGFLCRNMDEVFRGEVFGLFNIRDVNELGERRYEFHKLISPYFLIGKDVISWSQYEAEKYISHIRPKNVKKKGKMLLTRIEARFKGQVSFSTKIVSIDNQSKGINTPDACIPYSYEQFLALGHLIFTKEQVYKTDLLLRAIDNDACSQALLFMAMHYVCAWRKGDILNLNVEELESSILNLDDIIDDIQNQKYAPNLYTSVWLRMDHLLYIYDSRASKNNGELTYVTPSDFFEYMGLYLLIALYHKKRSCRAGIMSTRYVDNLNSYTQLLGDKYTEIFGDKIFRNRKMNKQLLLIYARESEKLFSLNIKTLPELVASYLRGHKFDLQNGQKTIFHYIGHSSDGMNVDEVAYEIFTAGTMGHYKHKLAGLMLNDYKTLSLSNQSRVLEAFDISPSKTELQLEAFEKMDADVNALGLTDSFEVFKKRLDKRIRDNDTGSNERNVFCLYSALSGQRNPECIGNSSCCECVSGKSPALCRYGLYSWHYIYNLVEKQQRILSYIEKVVEKQTEYIPYSSSYTKLQNTLDIYTKKYEFLDELIKNFILSFDLDKSFKDNLISLYINGGAVNALPKIH